MHFLVIGNPENRRLHSFIVEVDALKECSHSVISYIDLLDDKVKLDNYIRPNTVVKIDSPGENQTVRKKLIEYGKINIQHINNAFLSEFGRICYQDEWYRGFFSFLLDLKDKFSPFKLHFMNSIDSILIMFDKVETKKLLNQNKILTPIALDNIYNYTELRNQMFNKKIHNVFIKPAHSSSASGVIAFRTQGSFVKAISSVELISDQGDVRFYNSLKVRTYTDEKSIITLINNFLLGKVSLEQWIPKASFKGLSFDFRVVVINGKARHIVARTSKSPITNLHLGNARGNLSEIVTHISNERFESIKAVAENVAKCFPDCLYLGIDVLISANLRHIMVLEVNAFGDLLPNLIDDGETVYEAQIKASIQKWSKHETI
ncbi:hypothetical protein GCM10011514_53120 [Emticicia aquatilis]|uniref:ATP-grasp domain-containing protein n=1 Tax=Emticicia aquatilis TaxID=1537369 RepID=A0A916ZAI1_9BACT|nr:STM4014 family protein [Emticicia aquatilis]GGD82432.1 hypothetical protein GCM10011514_53120 [Emticicia aquatilis]